MPGKAQLDDAVMTRVDLARSYMGWMTEEEWWVVEAMDQQGELICPLRIYQNHRCPVPDYRSAWTRALTMAADVHAHHLVSVRYHMHAWWPTSRTAQRFQVLRTEAMAQGTPLQNHIVVDSAGEIISFRPQSGASGAPSGTSEENDSVARIINPKAAIPCLRL